ncbi:MAG: TIGR02206 family membrane protein [Oscillospiraceae bacterium]|nr:TIGR02206 family membrane protein [Oscillospiraceae bacterium]
MQYFLETVDTIQPGLGFRQFGGYHLLWLGILVAFCTFMAVQYRKQDTETRAKWRKRMAVAILLDELWKMFWLMVGGNYTLGYLPLHLCSINIILIALHAWKPNRTLDNFLYGVCIPGAMAAMLFPSWTALPPVNFMHLHSFTVHILLIAYPVMTTVGGDIRPDWRQLPRCILFTLCMAVPIYLFNLAFDTNFMFLMYAEEGNPLLLFEQMFGSHLVGFPVLGTVFVGAMYLILYLCRRSARRKQEVAR